MKAVKSFVYFYDKDNPIELSNFLSKFITFKFNFMAVDRATCHLLDGSRHVTGNDYVTQLVP